MYTEKELEEIVGLVQEGTDLDQAKLDVVDKRFFAGGGIKEIEDKVLEYFNIESVIPMSRKTEDIVPMAVFMYLVADLIEECRGAYVHRYVCLKTAKDRSTFLSYVTKVENDYHLFDTRIFREDYVCNHFLTLKEILTGEDLSNKKIERPKIEMGRTVFQRVMADQKPNVIKSINRGVSYKTLNSKYFGYKNVQDLRLRMEQYNPELHKKLSHKRDNVFSTSMEKFEYEIMISARKGRGFQYINDTYFGYKRLEDFRRMICTYEPDIAKILISNTRKNE